MPWARYCVQVFTCIFPLDPTDKTFILLRIQTRMLKIRGCKSVTGQVQFKSKPGWSKAQGSAHHPERSHILSDMGELWTWNKLQAVLRFWVIGPLDAARLVNSRSLGAWNFGYHVWLMFLNIFWPWRFPLVQTDERSWKSEFCLTAPHAGMLHVLSEVTW